MTTISSLRSIVDIMKIKKLSFLSGQLSYNGKIINYQISIKDARK